MLDSKGYRIKLEPIKLQEVVDIWLDDKPRSIREVCELTDVGYYQVQHIALALERDGHKVRRKKQVRNSENRLVISGNTEKDADKSREDDLKNKSDEAKKALKVRTSLDQIAVNRELRQIETECNFGI